MPSDRDCQAGGSTRGSSLAASLPFRLADADPCQLRPPDVLGPDGRPNAPPGSRGPSASGMLFRRVAVDVNHGRIFRGHEPPVPDRASGRRNR